MRSVIGLACSFVIAIAGLLLYDQRTVNVNQLDLDPSVRLSPEQWNGRPFTAWTVEGIKQLVKDYSQIPLPASQGCAPLMILWLGNSQLHFVNQYRVGDHVSPYWMRRAVRCPETTVPLGVSLPNANFQEDFILEKYIVARLPAKLILLELCFDSLRQDGLRGEFADFLSPADRQRIFSTEVGRQMLQVAESQWQGRNGVEENPGLRGFVQSGIENRLDFFLGSVSSLWRTRGHMRAQVLVDLYEMRNEILRINSGTVRKLIPLRYERNMQALELLLQDAERHRISVVGYVAPVRYDLPNPYDRVQYSAWKVRLSRLLRRHHAGLINLENLVPAQDWGTYDPTRQIDFVHFRNRGHQLVANALLPYALAAEKPNR